MDEQVWKFVGWIYQHYGRPGCAVALLIIIGALALAFFLLNRLPESKPEEK
jgi:hypothetical protein